MQFRSIPVTQEKIPVIGLGTWIQFDVDKSADDLRLLKEVLQVLYDGGGRMIDSSPMYGKAEERVGDLTSQTGFANDLFYATKVWTTGKENGIRQMEASLLKMRRKTIDLMQVHNLVDCNTHLATLREWKKEGKIRYIGVTHYGTARHADLERIISTEKIDFVQFKYSIVSREAEKSLLDTAADKGVAVIVHEPFETGKLFSRVKGKEIPEWLKEFGISSWAQLFLKFVLAHPAVTCVIPGSSDPLHMTDNMCAGTGFIPERAAFKRMISLIESY